MFRSVLASFVLGSAALSFAAPTIRAEAAGPREFRVSPGQTLTLDLKAGGGVKVTGDGGSAVSVSYSASEGSVVEFDEGGDGLKVVTRYVTKSGHQSSNIDIEIHVPRRFDVAIDSMGGSLEIDGVEGAFRGQTMGGHLTLHDVRGEAHLKTMGGPIRLTESELDGSLETMGGEVLFQDVTGDVRGSSMGGNVRYERVTRRDGKRATLDRLGDVDDVTDETVQITTMGGEIDVDEAPEGAALHTMGGDIHVKDARRFVSATTMGGDIVIDGADGWVKGTTMGGNIEATVVGSGGDVTLQSMSGDITLTVPRGFGMQLDLEIAYTKESTQSYRIITDLELSRSGTDEWDHEHGSPRKYLRATGTAGGGGNRVTIKTVNGDIRIVTGGKGAR